MCKVKILPCEVAYFLRSHPRRILKPKKDGHCVCQERTPFVIWIMVSRLKKASAFLVTHDVRHTPAFISKVICREYTGILSSHDLIFPKIPKCGDIDPDISSFTKCVQIGQGYFPCKDARIRKGFLAVAVKIFQLLRVS